MIEIYPNHEYKTLFKIHLQHNFYENGFPNSLTIEPSLDTRQKLRNWQLRYKTTQTGIQIIYDEILKNRLVKLLQQRPKLTFVVRNKNPYFFNFTALPQRVSNCIYHFHNRNIQSEEGKKLIQVDNTVGRLDILSVVNKQFGLTIGNEQKIEVKDIEGEQVWKANVGHLSNCMVNLIEEEEGKFTLWKDGKVTDSFYALNSEKRQPFGVIDIYLNDLLKVQDDGMSQIVFNEYYVRFKARATYWKYYFVGTNKALGYTNFRVGDTKRGIRFEEGNEVRLDGGLHAKIMVSREPIMLREVPKGQLTLKVLRVNKGVNFQMNLPHPPLEMITKDITKPEEFYSEVYVYL